MRGRAETGRISLGFVGDDQAPARGRPARGSALPERISLGHVDPSSLARDVSTSHFRAGSGMQPRTMSDLRPPPSGPLITDRSERVGYVTRELAPGVQIRVQDGVQVAVQNVGTPERPVFAVVPLSTPEPEVGIFPLIIMAAKAGVKAGTKALDTPEKRQRAGKKAKSVASFLRSTFTGEGRDDAPAPSRSRSSSQVSDEEGEVSDEDDDLDVGDHIQTEDGQTLEVQGFDTCGAVLVDSDGRRVFV